MTTNVNQLELEAKVKDMYRDVATNPHGEFHVEMGRAMAERLGYSPAALDRIPVEAIESFAGVGHFFHLAALSPGESVVDLGSGSGMDSFVASLAVGANGSVVGVDMTDEQLAKAERLRSRDGFTNVAYRKGYIEETGLGDGLADVHPLDSIERSVTVARVTPVCSLSSCRERWAASRRHRATTCARSNWYHAPVASGEQPTPRQIALHRIASCNAAEASASVVHTAGVLAGGGSIALKSSLQRHVRDAAAAAHHFTVAPHVWEDAGRVLLGRPSTAPMF